MDGSRQSLFESLERPALRPLPAARYEFATWRKARVNIDYHIEADRHYYSVPYQLAGQKVDVRLSAATVEVFCSRQARRLARRRSFERHRHTTDPAHMPESHRRHAEWTPSRIIDWAGKTGPATAGLVEAILASRPHPEQGYRSALGIIRLGRAVRRPAASRPPAPGRCTCAPTPTAASSRSSSTPWTASRCPSPRHARPRTPAHDNVRGAGYYH